MDELVTASRGVVITSLTVVEMISAFRRKYNRDEISEEDVNDLLAAFFEEALQEFIMLPMKESIQEFSFDLILEDDRRTLVSLQRSAGLSIVGEDTAVVFVTADAELCSTAREQGLDTINPAGT